MAEGQWLVTFQGRNHSGWFNQNFLWRHKNVYVMDKDAETNWVEDPCDVASIAQGTNKISDGTVRQLGHAIKTLKTKYSPNFNEQFEVKCLKQLRRNQYDGFVTALNQHFGEDAVAKAFEEFGGPRT